MVVMGYPMQRCMWILVALTQKSFLGKIESVMFANLHLLRMSSISFLTAQCMLTSETHLQLCFKDAHKQ